MFNLVVLTGRLTADPELKKTPNGISVTTFSIAVSRRYRAGEETQADFITIVAWRQTAEFITKYFTKGSMIGIEGSIQTRKYTDKNGNNRTAFEVVANNAQFVESKRDGQGGSMPAGEVASYSNADSSDFTDMGGAMDDDLPF
ncbi:MAG: single-stranded DNA-binding protein [Acutalibacteraceae bacterium]|nr:single-stranded DNA-binding protein [Acutalibacteraceae bacterium]